MREVLVRHLEAKLEQDPKAMIILCDLGWPAFNKLRSAYPERALNLGISEQAAVAVAAGLAHGGMKPYMYTMTAFALYRAFEFIRNDLCYNNNKVVIATVGSGYEDYPRENPTHNAIEDLKIASAIPNLTVMCPSDGAELESMLDQIDLIKTPVWIRIAKAGDYQIHEEHKSFSLANALNGPIVLKESDGKITIVTTGKITKSVLDTSAKLEQEDITTTVIECPIIKPLQLQSIDNKLSNSTYVVVVEESTGGLGDIIAKRMAFLGCGAKLICMAIPDTFDYRFGDVDYMLDQAALSKQKIYQKIKTLANRV